MTDESTDSSTDDANGGAGASGAPEGLLERHLPWIHRRVKARLGRHLRKKLETSDVVQGAMVEFLRYGPRIDVETDEQFRRLLARIVENEICDQNQWFKRKRRSMSREQPLPETSIVRLGGPVGSATRPDEAAQKAEEKACLRLALELLEPSDRQVLVLRQWEELSFEAVAGELRCTVEAARKRYARAVQRLAGRMEELQRGDLSALS